MVGGAAEGQRGRREATVLSALYGPVLTGGEGLGLGLDLLLLVTAFYSTGTDYYTVRNTYYCGLDS